MHHKCTYTRTDSDAVTHVIVEEGWARIVDPCPLVADLRVLIPPGPLTEIVRLEMDMLDDALALAFAHCKIAYEDGIEEERRHTY